VFWSRRILNLNFSIKETVAGATLLASGAIIFTDTESDAKQIAESTVAEVADKASDTTAVVTETASQVVTDVKTETAAVVDAVKSEAAESVEVVKAAATDVVEEVASVDNAVDGVKEVVGDAATEVVEVVAATTAVVDSESEEVKVETAEVAMAEEVVATAEAPTEAIQAVVDVEQSVAGELPPPPPGPFQDKVEAVAEVAAVEEVKTEEVAEVAVEEVKTEEVAEVAVEEVKAEEVKAEEVAEVAVEEVQTEAVAEVVEEVKTDAPVQAVASTTSLSHEQQLQQMEAKYRQAMMMQQQQMMNYFNQMLVQQNTQPQANNGKVTRVQRVIIVPVPAYSFGMGNMGAQFMSGHPHQSMPAMDMSSMMPQLPVAAAQETAKTTK